MSVLSTPETTGTFGVVFRRMATVSEPTKPRCTNHQGHHWHEADGTVFARVRDLASREVVPISCCHCQATENPTGWGERKKGIVLNPDACAGWTPQPIDQEAV